MKDVILIPRVSEKAYGLSQLENVKTYVFEVPSSANKHTVARAISVQYDVTVTGVRILTLKGKAKQSYRKGSRPIAGVRSDVKKAYITLKAGDSLPLFIEEAAEDAKAKKQAEKANERTSKSLNGRRKTKKEDK